MSGYAEPQARAGYGDWIIGTIRRNPEGLLLLAAGCALLMRRTGSWTSLGQAASGFLADRGLSPTQALATVKDGAARVGEQISDRTSAGAGYVEEAGRALSEQSGLLKRQAADQIATATESVKTYAASALGQADDARRNLAEQAQAAFQSGTRLVGDRPGTIAFLGFCAGAGLAALLPGTDTETRVLGSAREALMNSASKAGTRVVEAARAAGEDLVDAAKRGGLSQDGLKGMAADAAESFTSALKNGADGSAESVEKSNPQTMGVS